MATIINTNLFSLNAQKNLGRTQNLLATSLQRLSSGLRINSAKDDAAGLAISERMTAQIRGMNQALRNANDGISLAQTAESNLVEITNALQRIRELAVQSANGTNSTSDRDSLQKEVAQLRSEIKRIVDTAAFNDRNLFASTAASYATSLTFQVGANNGTNYQITVSSVALNSATEFVGSGATGAFFVSVSTVTAAQSAIDIVDSALTLVNNTRATFGAVQNRFESVIANLQNVVEATSAARSRIRDADFAKETANMTRARILQQAGTAMLAQANTLPQTVLTLLRG